VIRVSAGPVRRAPRAPCREGGASSRRRSTVCDRATQRFRRGQTCDHRADSRPARGEIRLRHEDRKAFPSAGCRGRVFDRRPGGLRKQRRRRWWWILERRVERRGHGRRRLIVPDRLQEERDELRVDRLQRLLLLASRWGDVSGRNPHLRRRAVLRRPRPVATTGPAERISSRSAATRRPHPPSP
jgi:hypothetical protein